MIRAFLWVFAIHFSFSAVGQALQEWNVPEYFPIPGYAKPDTADFSAHSKMVFEGDSMVIRVVVRDDSPMSRSKEGDIDGVDVWFAHPSFTHSDYILADGRLFRNSNEPGDNASLERFLRDGDYPEKRTTEVNGKKVTATVPPRSALKEGMALLGITHLRFEVNKTKGIHADREYYKPFAKAIGGMPDDLSEYTRAETIVNGDGSYTLILHVHYHALGFVEAQQRAMKIAIDVRDADQGTRRISSTPNRFGTRPYYFSTFNRPWDILPEGMSASIRNRTGMYMNLVRIGKRWMPFGTGYAQIVYGEDWVSEAGLVEISLYPISLRSFSLEPPFEFIECLEVRADDPGYFLQNELYFFTDSAQVMVGKGYRYNEKISSDFVNRPFRLPDGSLAFALYDFEPADPMGWGEYGQLADEFVYIQKVDQQDKMLYSGGQRIAVVHKATLGEADGIALDHVESTAYQWVVPGSEFKVIVKFSNSQPTREFRFQYREGEGFRYKE